MTHPAGDPEKTSVVAEYAAKVTCSETLIHRVRIAQTRSITIVTTSPRISGDRGWVKARYPNQARTAAIPTM